eukprot:gene11758-24657_t
MCRSEESNKDSSSSKKNDNEYKTERINKLKARFSSAELRKWASSYGIADDADDSTMLQSLAELADGILDRDRPKNLPLALPKFTLKTIKDAIPKHCFQRNLLISLSHLLSDLTIISCFFYFATWISHPTLPAWSPYILWPIYWYAQGAVFTGVWVLAHECGHQAFSSSELANNIIGTILHSLLLVPYHSWRITHGRHHNNTGSCANDEVFAPNVAYDHHESIFADSPLGHVWGIVVMLTVGWMPGYLVFNATGPKKY